MPVVKASLADISTDFTPIEPGEYEMEVIMVELQEKEDGREVHIITSTVTDPGEFHNRKVLDFIHVHKKDGSDNPVGLAQLKRYFEAIAGDERANEEGLDTDELVGGHFSAELTIESYEQIDPASGERIERRNNRIMVLGPA